MTLIIRRRRVCTRKLTSGWLHGSYLIARLAGGQGCRENIFKTKAYLVRFSAVRARKISAKIFKINNASIANQTTSLQKTTIHLSSCQVIISFCIQLSFNSFCLIICAFFVEISPPTL